MKSDWKKIPLSKVLRQAKKTFLIQDKTVYKQITVSKNGSISLREEKNGGLIGTKKQTIVKSGWFIYSRLGLPDGAFGLIPKDLEGAIVTGDMPVFEIDENQIIPEYLNYILRNSEVFDFFKSKFKGSAQSRVREPLFLSLEIPLPSLPEQKRIVKKIKEIEEKEKAIIKLEKYIGNAVDNIVPSALEKIFGASGWEKDQIGNLIEEVKTGTTPPSGERKYYKEERNWFTPPDFRGQIYLENSYRKISQLAIDDGKVKIYQPGTVLFIGIGATLGKVGILKNEASSNQQITGIRFKKDILPEFAYYWFKANYSEIRGLCPATTLPILNQEKIKKLIFSYPKSTTEQKKIIDHLNLIESKKEEIQQEKKKKNLIFSALMPSVLAKAFNGDL